MSKHPLIVNGQEVGEVDVTTYYPTVRITDSEFAKQLTRNFITDYSITEENNKENTDG